MQAVVYTKGLAGRVWQGFNMIGSLRAPLLVLQCDAVPRCCGLLQKCMYMYILL